MSERPLKVTCRWSVRQSVICDSEIEICLMRTSSQMFECFENQHTAWAMSDFTLHHHLDRFAELHFQHPDNLRVFPLGVCEREIAGEE